MRQRPELRHVSSDRDGKGATGAGADKQPRLLRSHLIQKPDVSGCFDECERGVTPDICAHKAPNKSFNAGK